MAPAVKAYIGLGSNLQDPLRQVSQAILELADLPASRVENRSSFYRSAPMGPADQPDYINAVVELSTTLSPIALLDELQRIEAAHHRTRTVHWGARTLDLDLLVYGAEIIREPRLTVPHPGVRERAFVLVPLCEIAPQLVIPGLGEVASLAAQVSQDEVTQL